MFLSVSSAHPTHVLMKQLLLALLLVSFAATSALADSPDAILKDYRKAAAQALERVNQSLEKAATPLITKLVSSGDTAGAEELTSQLKAKLAGEPVSAPQASTVQLFALYDDARAKALAPVQKSSIARIESLLKTAGGAKLEMVTELGKAREEIEAGSILSEMPFPEKWTYHRTPTSPVMAEVLFSRDGKWKIVEIPSNKETESGTWTKKTGRNMVDLIFQGTTWKMTFDKKSGVIDRPDTGKRFIFPAKD